MRSSSGIPAPVPVISRASELEISWPTMETLIGGRSAIDLTQLQITDAASAGAFLNAYGFDPNNQEDRETLLEIQRHALDYLRHVLLPYHGISAIPARYAQMPVESLLQAASKAAPGWPNWPCLLLKLIHCATHALYTHNTQAHQRALIRVRERFRQVVSSQQGQLWIGDQDCRIPLAVFDIKEQKSFNRTMTKLLHKPGNLAVRLFDRIGVRLVTYDIFSAILLIKFLRSRNVVMFANNLPECSRNSLTELEEIRHLFQEHPPTTRPQPAPAAPSNLAINAGDNPFSHRAFKVIKFTERLLVKLADGRRTFFPYEIQILDHTTWQEIQTGDAAHEQYAQRQLERVRQRVFGRKPS